MTRAASPQLAISAVGIAIALAPALQSQTVTPSPAPQTIALSYAPADTSLHEIRQTFETVVTEGETRVVDLWERASRLLVTCTDEGYTNSVTIMSQTLSRNGNPVPSPVHAAMAELGLTHTLTKDGTLVSVAGYDQLPRKMAEKFAAPFAATMGNLLNVESLRQRDEQDYQRLYAGILGQEMTVGAAVAKAENQDLPEEGHVPLYSVTVATREGTGDDALVKVTSTLNSNPTTLATQFDGIESTALTAIATEAKLTGVIPDSLVAVSVAGTDETVLDPAGLLIGTRATRLAFTLTPKVAAGETPSVVTITQTRTFEATRVEKTVPSAIPAG